ncbi:hypothetical protein ACIBG8_06920 [Nonomuraea sp. NPDC050556]|uniref:hypothetical protein n=1 Tax=Nonomuraea sp. NPDC050556 TaxID=3364369 RepID=UPI0037AE5EF6
MAGPIRERYGPLQASLSFADLRAALADLGVDLIEQPSTNAGYREYRQPDTAVHLLVTDGHVDHITAPSRPVITDVAVDQQRIRHLLQASDERRLAWSDRHRPDAGDAANWWLGMFLQIERTIHRNADQRLPATRLYLWAVRRSHQDGAFSAGETAIRVATLFHGYAAELGDVLPTRGPDRPRLPRRPPDHPRPGTRSPHPEPGQPPGDARQAKNLISAAAPACPTKPSPNGFAPGSR